MRMWKERVQTALLRGLAVGCGGPRGGLYQLSHRYRGGGRQLGDGCQRMVVEDGRVSGGEGMRRG